MVKTSSSPEFVMRSARDPSDTLFRWLYAELRDAILSGRLPPGARMPSSRDLARQHGLSRTTVVSVFDQLAAEGYVLGKTGSGTRVKLAETSKAKRSPSLPHVSGAAKRRAVKSPASFLPDGRTQAPRPFEGNLPALDAFPREIWARIVSRRARSQHRGLLADGDSRGYRPLREILADYLSSTRGVRCSADSVIIVSGLQQGLDLIIRLIMEPGDAVWMEDPGYFGAHQAFVAAGARIVPLPVDTEGLVLPQPGRRLTPPRLIYVTPARQSPTGVSMSPERRLALLNCADQHAAWIFEDDYDGEYRYTARPLAALQGIDQSGSVIHSGSFSKVMFPALRLGYVVLPEPLIEPFTDMLSLCTRFAPSLEQSALCDFIEGGHFARHVRAMRELYRGRHEAMLDSARRHIGDLMEFRPAAAGLETVGWLPAGSDDQKAAAAAAAQGIVVRALSSRAIRHRPPPGLLVGVAAFDARTIDQGIRRLARGLEKYRR